MIFVLLVFVSFIPFALILKGIGGNFGKRNSVLYKHSNLSAYGKKLFW
ncbi:MAG: hypothetical protein ACPGSL_08640 [Vicingaceae bacterium]